MSSGKFSEKRRLLKSWQWAAIYLAIWLIPVVGIKLLADNILGSMLLHIAYTMILLPAVNVCIPFIYTRRCGLRPWLIIGIGAAAAVLYAAFDYSALSPNFLVSCLVCCFFGFGFGNILKDEARVAAQEDIDSERRKKRLAAEKAYVPILEQKSKGGKKKK